MGTLPETESIRLDDRTIAPEEESLRVAESEEKSDPSECQVDTSPESATAEAMVSCAADQPTPSSSSPSRVRDGDEATPEEREKLLVPTTSSAAAAVVVVGNGSPARTSWRKVRQGVAVTSAMASSLDTKKRRIKKTGGGLSRQDSFMARFSTRQQADDAGDIERHRSRQEGTRLARCRAKLLRRLFGVITTDSTFMGYWLLVLTSAVLYNVWMCIARESFPELQREYQLAWYVLDGCADAIYALDILVQVRTGYLEQGIVITDARKLAAHYLRSKHVIVDVLSLTPLDLVQLWTAERHPMLRFPRYLKAYRAVGLYYNIESRSAFPNLWRVVNLIHILLLLAHWFAGFYYTISVSENFVGRWTYPTPVGVFATLRRKYLACLYWSTLTLTTIGDLPPPETNSQKWERLPGNSDGMYVFTIVSYLIGVFVFATIVGQVGNIITNRNANRLEFERLLDGAKQYMRNHSVPMDMQKRVMRWYIYSWSRGSVNGGGDIHSLGLLPDKLKTELALHVNLSTLKKVTIFQECQPEFLHDLVLKMKGSIFTPGDLICRKGEVAREMFIIADGILEVIGEDGTLLRQMSAGDFFGEIGILNLDCGLNRRSADVRSVGYSELFTLSREDVLAAMRDYPEAESIIKEYGRIRLIEAKKHNIPTPTVVVTTLDVVKDTSQSCSSSSADGATNATQNVQPSNAESEREGAAEVVCESTNRNQADSSSTTNPREDSWEEVTSPAPLASVDEEHEESPKDVASEIIEYTVKAVHQKLDEIRDRCEETITTLEKDIARKNEVIEELEAKVELLEMCHNY